jgi:hypothetical protein
MVPLLLLFMVPVPVLFVVPLLMVEPSLVDVPDGVVLLFMVPDELVPVVEFVVVPDVVFVLVLVVLCPLTRPAPSRQKASSVT